MNFIRRRSMPSDIVLSNGMYVNNAGSLPLQYLIDNKHVISGIRSNLSKFYHHERIGSQPINDKTVTIVMTSSNRSKQTYYTLQSIANSQYKNVQVVLVDDSVSDPIDAKQLETYPFVIDFVRILSDIKTWANPCVNYNIGFQFVEGGYVIIQNAEVFHVGDVISCCALILNNSVYCVFDVRQSAGYDTNELFYKSSTFDTSIYGNHSYFGNGHWYQSAEDNNRALHFLSGMSRSVFNKIGGFSYDYSLGDSYDDDDLILKIHSLGIKIVSASHKLVNCGGIHLYHTLSSLAWAQTVPTNNLIYKEKLKYFSVTGKYLELV